MLDKKANLSGFLIFEFKMGRKAAEGQLATSTTHLAQELLTNVERSGGSGSFAKKTRALRMSVVASHQKLKMTNWEHHWSWSSIIIREVAKELNVDHSMVIWHLKQIGKVKKWVPRELTTNQKSRRFEVSFLCSTEWNNKEPFLGQIVTCKVAFRQQPAITSPAVGLGKSSKALPKAKLAPEKAHDHCLVVCRWSDPLQLSESWQNQVCSANQWDAPKTAVLASGIGQQKGPTSSPWQSPTTCCTPRLQKLNKLGCKVLPHSPFSPDLSSANYHFFKHLDNFLRGKCFHNQQEAENAFQEFIKSWSTNFYATRISKHISHWQKCADGNGSYFD